MDLQHGKPMSEIIIMWFLNMIRAIISLICSSIGQKGMIGKGLIYCPWLDMTAFGPLYPGTPANCSLEVRYKSLKDQIE